MANTLKEHKLVDNQKRAVLKYVWISDGTAVANSVLVSVRDLAYALDSNASPAIVVNGGFTRNNYATTIKRVYGQVNVNEYMKLQWDGNGNASQANSEIFVLASGDFDYTTDSTGATGTSALMNPDPANSTGNIVFSVPHARANDTFTLILDIRKDNQDYDAGQTADPVAFNQGPGAFPS